MTTPRLNGESFNWIDDIKPRSESDYSELVHLDSLDELVQEYITFDGNTGEPTLNAYTIIQAIIQLRIQEIEAKYR